MLSLVADHYASGNGRVSYPVLDGHREVRLGIGNLQSKMNCRLIALGMSIREVVKE